MYLVDTNVISAGAPGRALHSLALVAWMDVRSDALYLSAVTIAELTEGIAKADREGSTRKAAALREWLETLLILYGRRVLALDVGVARVAGELSDRARAGGYSPGFADIAIAATAKHHGLTILTRNLRHFVPLGIAVADPFQALPA